MLRLKTLGGLSLESERGPLGGAAVQRRRLSVLAVLAVSGERGMSRDKLVGLLWPEVEEARARSALSQALYALKRDCGEEDLVTGYERLALNTSVVTCDATDFESALARGDLVLAANVYGGPFLDGVYLANAPGFEHWLDGVRFRFAQAAERALERLAVDADARKDHAAAVDWWRRLTAIDPLKTRAVVGLMEALASAGDRAGAIRQAERYVLRARDELDGEASDAVTELAGALRGEVERIRVDERFLIERELGRGGMAVVYLACDTKHDRLVALKMLHPDMSAAVGRERLEREIRVTAKLQHPHILPLHDSGEWADALYYVMPFVEGESLRARLGHEPRLPLSDALAIAQEVAQALGYAHQRGVVHRDVKPENILLSDGHAVVADFGIARVVSGALDPKLTRAGIALGTPAYMAPEQVGDGEEVGPPSDVFSLGCMMFEMLTGRPPWIGASASAVLAQRFTKPAPPMRGLRSDVPPWLDDLVREMIASDPSRRPATGAEVARLLAAGGSATAARIPLMGDEMVGRDAELRSACSLLERSDVILLTLTGPGGTGKTRLAIQMAHELESRFDRVYFVDLSTVREPAAVGPAIASVAGVQPHAGQDLLDTITAAWAGRRTLLVLDNFEQVVSAAPVVRQLATTVRSIKLLVTSRMRLGIRAEHEFFVAPLSVPSDGSDTATLRANPAVQLFTRRALRANEGLCFDDDAIRETARICARLDGLPLAIELAAARCRLMSPHAVAARVDTGFDLLSGGGRDMPERHQTIRRAVAWSYTLLNPDEQRLFGRMAVFIGGCTLPAVESVCVGDDGRSVLDGVGALVDASLLMRDMGVRGGEPRVRMLETVRGFALEMLAADPDADGVASRHGDWFRRLAGSLAPRLTGESQHQALATLAADHANFGAALERALEGGDAATALALGASLWRYWLVRGYLAEGRAWLERALALPASAVPEMESLRADVMTGAAHIAQNTGAVGDATRRFRNVLEMRRRLGDRVGRARALADLGWVAWRRCDFAETRRLSTECLTLAQELGLTRVAALALTNLGAAALFEGSYEEACDAFARSAELREAVADRRGVAFANTFLAWSACRGGDSARALELLEPAERVLKEVGDQRLVYFARDVRAEAHLRDGNAARAAEILEIDSISGVRRFGDRWSVAHGLAVASWASRLLGRTDHAIALAEESLELRRAEGDRHGEAECLVLLAAAARVNGHDATAVELLQQSREIRAAIGDAAGVAECDAELSHIAALA